MRTLHSLICWLILGFCLLSGTAAAQHTVSGTLRTPLGAPLRGVVVHITGDVSDFVLTDSTGRYQATLPAGGAYTFIPYCNNQHPNGVTTFDMVLVRNHIIGLDTLETPYKRIAADVNNNGLIDFPDTNDIRQVILAQVPQFPSNTSWRFVRADYVFPDPENPFQPPYPESFVIPNLNADVIDADFVGIKIGDINYSALLGNLTDSSYISWIDGTVARDANSNCQLDSGESPLQNWTVRATNQYGNFYGKTRPDGTYTIAAPQGTYAVTLFPPNNLWDPCAATQNGVTTTLLGHTTGVDFPVQVAVNCPYLEVDLATPFLRRCFNNAYSVFYCNTGTTTAEDAYVEVSFDSLLVVQSSSIPWTTVNDNTYTFPLGDVPSGFCGSFYVTVLVNCGATPGQTHCSSAQIYPDSLCGPPPAGWSGANLVVEGHCNGDEVVFQITNTGDAMTESADYVVIEDIMVQMSSGSVLLGPNQSETVTLPANGSTWRLEVEQAPNHPWSLLPSAAVEGCVTGGGNFSTGFITQFPFGDEGPTYDVDCQENRASYDPNDKQGFPLGVQAAHYIPKGQVLNYKIRFQNTGTDTAFNIVILDTLSALFDISTLRPGAGSHPYTFNLLGAGILQFKFQNIMLPDSNVNEPLSHGFLQYSIAPKADLPDQSVLENGAAIYFDFNDPVQTNTTWHTLGEQYLNVSNIALQPGVELEVFPNPAAEYATFFLKRTRTAPGQLALFDLQGRQVRAQVFQNNRFEFRVGDLPPGVYFFRIDSEGRALASGKLVLGGQ